MFLSWFLTTVHSLLNEPESTVDEVKTPQESPKVDVEPIAESKPLMEEVVEPTIPEVNVAPEQQEVPATGPLHVNTSMRDLEEGFPALFFEVMGQTFSVPLVKLKGIYRRKELTKLIGKPNWFSGVQIERDEQMNVIDTARYLMPEKYGTSLEYSPNYQYIIVIGDSNWGLECNRLIDSTTLSHDEIKWRTDVTRSPWLAGTVKHRMCGLLAVDALIELFENNETK